MKIKRNSEKCDLKKVLVCKELKSSDWGSKLRDSFEFHFRIVGKKCRLGFEGCLLDSPAARNLRNLLQNRIVPRQLLDLVANRSVDQLGRMIEMVDRMEFQFDRLMVGKN